MPTEHRNHPGAQILSRKRHVFHPKTPIDAVPGNTGTANCDPNDVSNPLANPLFLLSTTNATSTYQREKCDNRREFLAEGEGFEPPPCGSTYTVIENLFPAVKCENQALLSGRTLASMLGFSGL